MLIYCPFQFFHNPGVQAFPVSGCGRRKALVLLWRHADIKASRIGFVRLFALFPTQIKIHLHRLLEFAIEFINRSTVKGNDGIGVDYPPMKHPYVRIILNHSDIILPLHSCQHSQFPGAMPHSCKNSRKLVTAPLSRLGEGCGLWSTKSLLRKEMATREPSRSLISAPNARNRTTASRHCTLPLTGRWKISSSVLAYLRFMAVMVPKRGIILN
jgi:hypothetical protein